MRRAMTIGAVALAAALTGAGAASAVASATASEAGPPAEPAAAHAEPAGRAGMPAFGPMHGARGERMLYGEAVSAGKDGKKHYHVWQHGKVTSVSASSLAVRSTDGTTWTWTVNDDTKVRSTGVGGDKDDKGDKGDKTEIGDVKVGDEVLVAGTRSGSTRTAIRVIDPAPDFELLRERRKELREFGEERREDRRELRERLKELREDMPRPEPT